ncbi:hypothetical protein ACFOGI_04980 [Virgibacillus xinjiangensis]|uniref:YesK-like protein n=1 Tax=Virgibacillus xinjiangensis TaxID=393090 RepID=A0ABV7CTE5_9BACI
MVQSVITIGIILTAALVVLGLFLAKTMDKASMVGYYPGIFCAFTGLLLILTSSILDRVDIMGAGLGGWGIAFVFAGAVGLVITSIFDAKANAEA